MKIRNTILALLVFMSLLMAFIPAERIIKFKLEPQQMLNEVREDMYMIHPDIVADMLVNKDPSLQLIDIRTPEEYENFHLEGAYNVPLSRILDPGNLPIFNQDIRMNVLYSNGSTDAQAGWMLLRQLGFKNNYVMQGGLNYWTETILNPSKPSNLQADDEIAKYDFRQGASQHFGGAPAAAKKSEVEAPKRPVIRKKKKRAPQGGC